MKGKLTKEISGIILLGVILMYLFSGVSFAVAPQIDITSLDGMEEIPTDTTTPTAPTTSTTQTTPNNNTPTNNIVNPTTNNTIANTSTLPQTGSNNGIIFAVGLTILIGTTVFIYKKTKIM